MVKQLIQDNNHNNTIKIDKKSTEVIISAILTLSFAAVELFTIIAFITGLMPPHRGQDFYIILGILTPIVLTFANNYIKLNKEQQELIHKLSQQATSAMPVGDKTG